MENLSAMPRTFLVGVTGVDREGLYDYLKYTKQEEFVDAMIKAEEEGVSDAECLVSFFAKLCYRSLVAGKNQNVTKRREIKENLEGTIRSGHGSVFEHVTFNFVTTDCSRVFTHELVRHRVGTAFSQTSGRYCTVQDAKLVLPPELEDYWDDCEQCGGSKYVVEASGQGEHGDREQVECPRCSGNGNVTVFEMMLEDLRYLKERNALYRKIMGLDEETKSNDFDRKKRLTSALRRAMPNGATNEIGWSLNVRSLRHLLELRSSPAAEWEIRLVFGQVLEIVEKRWPGFLYGMRRVEVYEDCKRVRPDAVEGLRI